MKSYTLGLISCSDSPKRLIVKFNCDWSLGFRKLGQLTAMLLVSSDLLHIRIAFSDCLSNMGGSVIFKAAKLR